MPLEGSKKLSHLRYIDALRGVAFLAVLTFHVGVNSGFSLKGLTTAGQYGVQLFFLMSAVTLLRSHSMRRAEQLPYLNFYLRRFFRIAPLFWFGIVLYYFLEGSRPRFWAPDGLRPWHFLSTLAFLHGWMPTSINSVVPGGWSIAVEMMFYLILPLLWDRIRSASAAVYWTIGSLILNGGLSFIVQRYLLHGVPDDRQYLVEGFLYFWFPAQACVFLLGFLLYRLLLSERITTYFGEASHARMLWAISIYCVLCLTHSSNPVLLPRQFVFAVALLPLIVAIASRPSPLIVNNAVVLIGKLSFSCYITHFAMIDLVLFVMTKLQIDRSPGPVKYCLLWICALSVTVLASSITYRLIEQPGVRLGNAIIRRLEARTAQRRNAVAALAGV